MRVKSDDTEESIMRMASDEVRHACASREQHTRAREPPGIDENGGLLGIWEIPLEVSLFVT